MEYKIVHGPYEIENDKTLYFKFENNKLEVYNSNRGLVINFSSWAGADVIINKFISLIYPRKSTSDQPDQEIKDKTQALIEELNHLFGSIVPEFLLYNHFIFYFINNNWLRVMKLQIIKREKDEKITREIILHHKSGLNYFMNWCI